MAKVNEIAPAGPDQDALERVNRIRTRTWSDREVASLCIAQSLVGLLTEEKLRHPTLTRWRRAYREFCAKAIEGKGIDYADSRERLRLKELTEQIRLGFQYATRHPHAKKKGA